jgi:putative ABC transport system permease protein
MIALPVAAVTFGAVVYDTFTLSPAEEADREMGAAQAVMTWPSSGRVMQEPSQLGFAVAQVSSAPAERTTEQLLALLPAGSTAIRDQLGSLTVHTASGVGTLDAQMLDYADPLARGILRPLSGRPPAGADEVALTPRAVSRLGAGVGDSIRLADGRALQVVGTVEDPAKTRAAVIVLPQGALPASALGGAAAPGSSRWLVATPGPVTWDQVKQLNTHGVVALSRYVMAHPPPPAELYPGLRLDNGPTLGIAVLVGGLALLEIVLLAGPAFAVGARRRRRDLALVAAAGGTPAQLRRIVLADGVVLGAVAAVTGLAVGIAVAAAGRPLIEEYLARSRSGAFRVYPMALAAVAAAAVLTGLLAALVPAWIASRQDVVAALAGRRGITRSRRRWLVLGVGLTAAGAALAAAGAWLINATLILTGLVVAELGLVLCTPAIVGLVARLGRRLPLAPRIALRDTARNRTAAAPAISAVMAAVVGSLAVGVVFLAETRRDHDDFHDVGALGLVSVVEFGQGKAVNTSQPTPPRVTAVLRETMPVQQITQVSLLTCRNTECAVGLRVPPATACPYSPDVLQRDPTRAEQRAARHDRRCDGASDKYGYFGVFGSDGSKGMAFAVDAEAGPAVVGVPPQDAAAVTTALRSGAVVVNDPRYLDAGRATLILTGIKPDGPKGDRPDGRKGGQRTVTAPGFALPHPVAAPFAMLTPATARSLGLAVDSVMRSITVATTTRVPTTDEQDRLTAALGSQYVVQVQRGAPQQSNITLVVLSIVAGVITLAAAAIATGLAAADGRADLTTLAAVGASPRVRRALSLSQSGVIAGLGSLLGVAAGLGAAVSVLFALNQRYAAVWPAPTPYPITVPWLNLTVALLVVPAIAMLGAGLLTRSRLPIERRAT